MWINTSTPAYVFMARWLIKLGDTLYGKEVVLMKINEIGNNTI
jgi:hypothetical protein